MTRCTVQNVRHWSAVSFPALGVPTSRWTGESQDGRIVRLRSRRTTWRVFLHSTGAAEVAENVLGGKKSSISSPSS